MYVPIAPPWPCAGAFEPERGARAGTTGRSSGFALGRCGVAVLAVERSGRAGRVPAQSRARPMAAQRARAALEKAEASSTCPGGRGSDAVGRYWCFPRKGKTIAWRRVKRRWGMHAAPELIG